MSDSNIIIKKGLIVGGNSYSKKAKPTTAEKTDTELTFLLGTGEGKTLILYADESIRPTINALTGQITVPGGIANYYNKQEVDARFVGVYHFKGSVETYDDLPANPENGDVYNIKTTDESREVRAGDNLAWVSDLNEWDNLGSFINLTDYYTKQEINELLIKFKNDYLEVLVSGSQNELETNKVYKISISANTGFTLPDTVDETIHNQIKIIASISNGAQIFFGADYYFNGETPDVSDGNFMIFYDYDPTLHKWVCGMLSLESVSSDIVITANITPEDAEITFSGIGALKSDGFHTVKGSTINYTVKKAGYVTESSSVTVNTNSTLTVVLVPEAGE